MQVNGDLSEHLVGDALENVVAAFDGFGRELCARRHIEVRFQNIESARKRVQETFGFDFADALSPEDWATISRVFQKRHLLAHKMGVMDDEYVKKAGDPAGIIGRKVRIDPDEVSKSAVIVATIGRRLFQGILA